MKNLFTLTFWVSIIASLSSLAQTPDIDVKFNMISIPNNTSASTTYGTSFGLVALSNGMPNNEFTIENRGTGTLTISSIDIIGTAASDFTVSNSPSTTLAPNATTTLRITFNPSVADRRSATVTITSNDPDENPFRINLFGTGMQPEMDVFGNGNPIANGSSTPITNNHTHFGAEFVTGGSIVRTFTIENNDLASLNLTGTPTKVAITGTHASDFTLTAAPSSSVARSQSTTFQITFNPSGNGVRTALLTIANDDEDENPYTFTIEGIGTTPSPSADYTISTANNTVTITDVSGNGETMEVSESNSNVRFFVSGRTYRIDGGAVTPFTTPADIPISSNTGIVVNTNAGNDIITVGAFTSSLPSLTINGGVGDDIVNMNGNITFAANANLDLDLQNDDTSPGRDVVNIGTNANVILAGTGSATIKVSQNVFVNTGGGLTTANGNLLVEANQQGTPTSGNFVGVRLNGLNALFQVTGSGLLTVKGKGGDTGNGTSGIFFYSGAKILGGTNTVTLEGTGGPTSGNISAGVYAFENSEVRSTGGNIVINGIGDGIASTNTLCHGIFVRGVIAAGGLGNVTLTGRGSLNYTEAGASGVYISSGTVTTAGGNITFNGYGGGLGNSTRCLGVFLIHSSVSPGGMGTLTIYGEGGPGTGTDNYGVGIGCAITSSGGNIIVTGKEGGGNFSQGVIVDNTDINASNGEIRTATNGGDITVTANSFVSALDNQALITGHPSNKITFLPLTNGTEINFVSTREVASSPILISDFEFDNITGGAFYFGDANTGAINVNEAITHAAGNVYFTTGQALNLNQSFGAGTGNIAINAAGGINPKSTTVDLSGNTISFTSGNNLTIAIGGTTVNTGYDQLNIQGTIDLRGLNLVLSGSYVPVAGNTFIIVNNDGTDPIVGTFNGLAQGATIPNFRGSGLNATISYTGGTDNNDVVITVAAPAVSNINIKGNGFTIDNGDTSPRTEDGTDFGNIDISLTEPVVRTFTIENTGTADLVIPAGGITKSGAADFGIGNVSLPLTIAPGSSATFPVIIDASGNGRRTATISIQSNDPDASPYTFDVTAVGVSPEINVTGLGQNIADGDLTPSGVDDTDFGIIDVASGSVSHTFTIQNVTGATGNLQLNAGAISVTGTHASDFTVSAITLPATISAGQSTTFVVTFNPSAEGLRTATVRILNNDLGEGTYDFAVQGYGGTPFITTWKTDNTGTSNSTSITIPTTGTGYNYDVDWNNDGTFDEFGLTGSVTHNYGTAGTYSVAIRGDFPRIYFNSGGDSRKLVSIDQWGSIAWTSMNSAFRGCANMVLNATDVPNLGAVTDMSSMFYGCSSFNQALPEGFNTSAATNMSYMFAFCSSYNQALPSTFNTSMVVDMSGMFRSCSAYNQPLPNSFNTQRVTDMSEMFYGCTSYNKALPNVFNTSLVTNMKSMFYDCSSYNEPLPSSFNTERVTNMELMFQGCSIYNHALPSSFTTSLVTDMSLMFYDCRAFNQNLGSLNLGAVTNMTGMLTNSGLSVTNYDATLTGWNDGGYTNKDLGDASPLKYCAAQAARTNLITNKGWTITGDTQLCSSTITTVGTLLPFTACEGTASVAQSFTVSGSGLTADITITAPAGFEVSTTSGSAFGPSVTLAQNSGTVASTTVYVRLSATATGTPSDNVRLTSTNATDKTIAVSGTVNAKPTITLGTISAVSITSTSFSIPYTSTTGSPDQFSLVTGTPVAMPNFSAVNNQSMPASSPISVTIPASGAATYNFNLSVRKSSTGCVSAVVPVSLTVEAPAGRPFITRWDLSKTGSSSTGLSIGVQTSTGGQVSYTWTTVPAGTSGSGTFTGTSLNIGSLPANAIIDVSIYPTNFERININNGTDCQRLTEIKQWGEVAWTSMRLAFSGCSNMTLTAPDVPNLAGVMNMSFMFANCSSFNQALPEGFNTANVTDMWGMFSGCSAYNQALPSTFNTANVTRMVQMFNGCSSYNQALPISFTTANVTDMYGMFSNCSSYNQMLPSSFNTANVAYMNFMFRGCSSYNQAFPNSFNTANVTDMLSMFSGCSSFNQSLASFTLNANVNLVNFLDNTGLSVANYDATLTAFNAQNVTGRSMGAVGLNYCAAKSARDNLINNKGWTITGDNYTLACLPADYTITTTGGNVIITDVTGTGETLEVSENSGKIRFNVTGKTYSIDGGITTAFTTPAEVALSGKNSITVNTAGGNDIINVGAFTTQLPTLTINGGIGDDQVNMNGDITFVANANLDLDLQNDETNPGVDVIALNTDANLNLSGTGAITLKSSKNIETKSGSSLAAVAGNILIEANQQTTPTVGSFTGIAHQGTISILGGSGGVGAVTLKGKGGNGTDAPQVGVLIAGNVTGLVGSLTIEGTGGISPVNGNVGIHINAPISSKSLITLIGTGNGLGASADNAGVLVSNTITNIPNTVKGIVITGTGANTTGTGNHGISSNSDFTNTNGSTTLTGTAGNTASDDLFINSGTLRSSNNPNNSTNINLIGNKVTIGSAAVIGTNLASVVNLLPRTDNTPINLGTETAGSLSYTSDEMNRIFADEIHIGNATTGPITISAPIAPANISATCRITLQSSSDLTISGGGITTLDGNVRFGAANIYPTFSGMDVSMGTTGVLSTGSNNRYVFDINGSAANTGYTQLQVAGKLSLYQTRLTLTGSYSPSLGQTFMIINNTGTDPIDHVFLDYAEGYIFNNFLGSGQNAKITYVGGDGNDVVLTVVAAPVFTDSPDNQVVCAGNSASFTVASSNAASYKWQARSNSGSSWVDLTNVSPYSNVTTSTLSISDVAGLNNYQFRCVATNDIGSTNSDAATLTVTPLPDANISYSGSPFAQNAAPVSVNRTGTAGGGYTATPTGLTIDNQTGQITPSSSLINNYVVTYRIAASGGCAQFTTTASVEIVAAPTPDYTITTMGGNIVITDTKGIGETLEVSENSGKIRFNVTGKTYNIDGGITTAFTTPAEVVLSGKNSITVNTASGNDIINVGAFTTQLPTLTINGGTGDDEVNMNGNLTFTANANLDLDLQNDDVNAGMDEVAMGDNVTVSLSGTGTATVKASKGIVANAGANLSASSTISLITNSIDIKNTATISTNSASSVILRPYTNGVNIDLGAATNSLGGPLSLSDDELDRITAGTLQIGDANSGAITISAPISRAAATNVNLTTAGAVNLNASALATNGGTLVINAAGGINPTVAGTDVNVGTVSFASGNDLAIAINGTTADTDYHQLNVAGSVNLSGLDLVLSGSHVPVLGQTFVIVNNDGSDAIQGTFNGLPEGSTIAPFLGGQLNARISYVGGDGNDAVLTVIASVELPANTANVTICKNATASLTASCKVGQVTWYNAAGTTQLFVGSPLVTPTLTVSTSYKVRCELAPQLSGFVDVMVTVVVPPTISLSTLQQTLNEGNNPVLCDTDANPVNGLQFGVSSSCVSGSPVWRVQVGSGAWSNWSATAPVSQPSNNQPHRYQAACDANCASTYSGVIELTINNRASIPQNVSLLVDGVTVAVGETKEVCSLVTTTLTFNANCAAGEVILYSVDGGEYSTGVPVGLVDNQYHNYRVRCRKSDGTPSCVESESGVMRLKLVTIPSAPTVSLLPTSSCNPSASFSGQSTCGSLRTVWYNATTNVALPSLPSTVPSQTTSYYARCQTENGCVSEKSNVVTFTLTPTQVAPVITASQEIVCTGTTVTISANCPTGSQTFWNTGVTARSFEVAFNNVTKQTYWAKCLFEGGCQSSESVRKDIYWNAFVVTLINIGESKSAVKPANDKSLWTSQFITRDGGPELDQSTQVNPTLFYVENANKMAPRYWTINVEACGLSTDGSLTFDMLATPEMGVIRSFNTHENNAPYFMYANREGWTELYAQNHPAYGFYQDNGAGGNVYDAGLPKGLYKLGIRYWDQKGWGSIYPATRQPQGNVLAYQEYWFRIQSKDGVGVGAARTAESEGANGKGQGVNGEGQEARGKWQGSDNGKQLTDNELFATVLPNPVTSILRLKVQDSKGQVVQTVLTDVSGRSVLRRQFVPETNTHQEEFGVSELPTGMYFLKVTTADQQATLKVVKVQ